MNSIQQQAIEKLRQQQSQCAEGSAPFGVAEQLIDICQREPNAAALLNVDLDNPDMDIVRAELQIKRRANEIHSKTKSPGVFVPPHEAENILRKFYGLPDSAAAVHDPNTPDNGDDFLRFEDFL